jgi:hypothetical protein
MAVESVLPVAERGNAQQSDGTVTLTLDTVELNTVDGGLSNEVQGAPSKASEGEGIYVKRGELIVDAFTIDDVINNTDSNNDRFNNILP